LISCIFCAIAGGQAPAQILYQDDDVTAFHDLNPVAPVHVLVIPNVHIRSIADTQPAQAAIVGKLFTTARQLAEELGVAAGYRLVVNSGRPAGQSVFHLHVHLLAGRSFGWPPG